MEPGAIHGHAHWSFAHTAYGSRQIMSETGGCGLAQPGATSPREDALTQEYVLLDEVCRNPIQPSEWPRTSHPLEPSWSGWEPLTSPDPIGGTTPTSTVPGVGNNPGPSSVRSGEVKIGVRSQEGKEADMSDKSPRKTASKKSGKSLKEKRQAKKAKEQTHKPLAR